MRSETIVGRGGAANIWQQITQQIYPAKCMMPKRLYDSTEENIDVIEWAADPAECIYNAIAPAEVDRYLRWRHKRALVVVYRIISYTGYRSSCEPKCSLGSAHLTVIEFDGRQLANLKQWKQPTSLVDLGQDYVPAEVDAPSAEFKQELNDAGSGNRNLNSKKVKPAAEYMIKQENPFKKIS